MRWMPVAATGVPHATTEADEYRGWRISKGSIVFANAWGMLHDENMYPDPFVFRPERFLASDKNSQEPDPANTGAFGFGRRYVVIVSLCTTRSQILFHITESVQAVNWLILCFG